MNDREAIVEMTDEADRWMQKLEAERKAHEATRQAKLLAEAQLEYALARLVSPARAEIAEALADFWEAEAARHRKRCYDHRHGDAFFGLWDGGIGGTDVIAAASDKVPAIVWWHAHRRTTR